jgi:DegV family protein with EDD domain
MVAIVVDSAANVPPDLAHELGILTVPMYLHLGEAVYRDGVDLSLADFYKRLREAREPASSATPSFGDYLAAYERSGQREVLCVTVAGGVSSSYQQAVLAGQRFTGRVEVVDSLSASMAEGFLAVDAGRRLLTGAPLEEAAARARELAQRTWLFATVDTFEYLQRSGRVTKLQAYAATMLDIKPVFRMNAGEIAPVARARTRARALARIVDETVDHAGPGPLHLAVFHAAAEDDARRVEEGVRERTTVKEHWIVPVTPVIGAHTGPGLVGVAFYSE